MQAITFLVDEFVPFLLQLRIQIYFLLCNPNVTSLWHCNFSSIPLSRMEKIAKEGYTEQCRLPSWISPFIWLAAAIASADADMRRILHQAIPSGMPAPKGFCIRLFVTKKAVRNSSLLRTNPDRQTALWIYLFRTYILTVQRKQLSCWSCNHSHYVHMESVSLLTSIWANRCDVFGGHSRFPNLLCCVRIASCHHPIAICFHNSTSFSFRLFWSSFIAAKISIRYICSKVFHVFCNIMWLSCQYHLSTSPPLSPPIQQQRQVRQRAILLLVGGAPLHAKPLADFLYRVCFPIFW